MGAWGTQPFQSDAGLDLLDAAEEHGDGAARIRAALDDTVWLSETWAAVGAVVAAAGIDCPAVNVNTWNEYYSQVLSRNEAETLLDAAAAAARRLRDNPKWIGEWRSPGDIEASLNTVIAALEGHPRT